MGSPISIPSRFTDRNSHSRMWPATVRHWPLTGDVSYRLNKSVDGSDQLYLVTTVLLLLLPCLSGCANKLWSGGPPPLPLQTPGQQQASLPEDGQAFAASSAEPDLERDTRDAELGAALEMFRKGEFTPEMVQVFERQVAAVRQSTNQPAIIAATASAVSGIPVATGSRETETSTQLTLAESPVPAAPSGPAMTTTPIASLAKPSEARQPPRDSTPAPVPSSMAGPTAGPTVRATNEITATQPASRPPPVENNSADAARALPEASFLPPEPLPPESSPPESLPEESPRDWQEDLAALITKLEGEAGKELDEDESVRQESFLRLLYVIADRRDDAVDPIPSRREDDREFFKHLVYGLTVWLDAEGRHVSSRKAALSLREFRTAENFLANQSTLDVRNLALCREVISFGDYREFTPATFNSGDEVVLYVEIENFASTPVGQRFQTEFQCEYEIFDESGRRVTFESLPLDKQTCDNRRRDYFIAYRVFLPREVSAGQYSLVLTVEDVTGKKSNQATVEFRIR